MSHPSTTIEPAAPRGPALLWAVYLGVSWTWCIGMFLPVLLIRDHGSASWWVFALPNVLGAAAMGFVLRSQTASRRLVEAHEPAMLAFSSVTLCFHGFFLGWLLSSRDAPWWAGTLLFVGLVGIVTILAARDRAARLICLVGYLLSLLAMTWFIRFRAEKSIHLPPLTVDGGELDLLWLWSSCLLGFALCPYLDLTFHRARMNCSPRGARVAFALGFGLIFASMIVFTLLYSNVISSRQVQQTALGVLLGHVLLQACLTGGLHLRETARRPGVLIGSAVVAGLLVPLGSLADTLSHAGLSGGEVVYRLFMGFYGLVFPAYVYLRMLPGPRPLWTLPAAVLLAGPLFYLAYIQREMMYVLPGVLLVLALRLVPAVQARD